MKNHAADSKIRSPEKIDFRADGTHESHPTALELIWNRLEKSFWCFPNFQVKMTDNLGTFDARYGTEK